MKYNRREGFFSKMVKRRRDSLGNSEKSRGLLGKKPFLPPPFTGNRGGGHRAPAALGFSGGHREGEKGVRAMENPLPAPIVAGDIVAAAS